MTLSFKVSKLKTVDTNIKELQLFKFIVVFNSVHLFALIEWIPIHNYKDEQEKMRKYNEEFSWLGNQNHPPDIMIKGGDAIEVKKTQSANSDLALNSSYPKSTVQANK